MYTVRYYIFRRVSERRFAAYIEADGYMEALQVFGVHCWLTD